jgi:flagellar biosynthesis GTPase FlhF
LPRLPEAESYFEETIESEETADISESLPLEYESSQLQLNLRRFLLEGSSAGLDLAASSAPGTSAADDVETLIEQQLHSAGFHDDYITETLDAWRAEASTKHPDELRWLTRRVMLDLPVHGPLRVPRGKQTIIAVVGATGVGKTTSLAKLAAEFRLKQHRRVGLVTVDTYRIGAVEQLRTYAEIMDLQMEVAATPREMRDALGRLSDCELILIDTAGRSPLDEIQMRQLSSILATASPDEVHLAASVVAEVDSLHDVAERFVAVGANRLLLTKTDEAHHPGRIFRFLRETNLPVAYVANGQNVPDDLRPADSHRLAEWLLGSRPSKEL